MIFTVLLLVAAPAPVAATPYLPVRRVKANHRPRMFRTVQVSDCPASGCGAEKRSPYRLPLPVSGREIGSTKVAALSMDGRQCDIVGAKRCGGRTHALVSADTAGTGISSVSDVRFGPN